MKVWIVKYALTEGVYQEDVETCFDISPHMVAARRGGGQCFHRGEWFESRSDAIDAAEDMRDRKIKSLQKQIKRLEALTFEPKAADK